MNGGSDHLDAMGIQRWVRRAVEPHRATAGAQVPATAAAYVAPPARTDESAKAWAALEQDVSGCTLCALHRARTQTVFGVGDRQADWMIVGEAPGAEEDRQGEPFVGPAGKLLDEMLLAVGRERQHVFIANVLKCRPPANRDPGAEEIAACTPYLRRQIGLVAPRVILAVGRIAAQHLLGSDLALGKLRGRVHALDWTDAPVIVTYHPAYLLRSPAHKRKAWEDLRLAMRVWAERAR